ncbi:MAG: hypothetical protein ACXVBJ_09050 [Flavisolibacter sp.]
MVISQRKTGELTLRPNGFNIHAIKTIPSYPKTVFWFRNYIQPFDLEGIVLEFRSTYESKKSTDVKQFLSLLSSVTAILQLMVAIFGF